ncbi:MAG: hypothetical protein RLZZ58_1045 [Pseudomonadota bacterium]
MANAGTSADSDSGARTRIARLWLRLFPAPPAVIRTLLARDQYEAIQRNIPQLHMVAILNLLIIDVVLYMQGTQPIYWAWTPLIALFNMGRLIQWRRRFRRPASPANIDRYLHGVDVACTASIALCSLLSCLSFQMQWLDHPVLIPISLAFGAFSIAHCLAPLRVASHAALIVGVLPSGLLMMISGDFLALVIGFSASSVVFLKISFLRDQYRMTLDRLDMHRRVDELARTDPLTGLANRRAFHDVADRALAKARRGDGAIALALIDLDAFKPINDALGHAAGDAVLCAVAARLQAAAGRGARIGRMGGDEFVILFTDVRTDADLSSCTAALLSALVLPVGYEGGRIHVAASIGSARFPAHGNDIDQLLRHADKALYAVKAASRAHRDDVRNDVPAGAVSAA